MSNSKQGSILRLAVPSIVSNITVPLLGLCDVTIMGHVGGATHIAAIAVGSMIFNVIYWLFGFLRMGTSGLTAQAYGYTNSCEESPNLPSPGVSNLPPPSSLLLPPSSILRQSLLTALAIGLFIVVLQVPLKWLTFYLMHPTADVARLCTPYYYICIWGAPPMLGLYALTGWFIGMQDTRTPMVVAISQNIINIVTSLILVIGFHLGIVGVALGTLIARWAGFLMALAFLAHKYHLTHPFTPPFGGTGGGFWFTPIHHNTATLDGHTMLHGFDNTVGIFIFYIKLNIFYLNTAYSKL